MPPETAPDDDESALLSRIDDLRIASIRPLMPAACLIEELADASVVETIRGARGALSAITRGTDQRLAVVPPPSSFALDLATPHHTRIRPHAHITQPAPAAPPSLGA